MVLKMICLYHIKSRCNLLDTVIKRQIMMRIKDDSNKVICPKFSGNVFDVCMDDHDDMTLVDPAMKLPPRNI